MCRADYNAANPKADFDETDESEDVRDAKKAKRNPMPKPTFYINPLLFCEDGVNACPLHEWEATDRHFFFRAIGTLFMVFRASSDSWAATSSVSNKIARWVGPTGATATTEGFTHSRAG